MNAKYEPITEPMSSRKADREIKRIERETGDRDLIVLRVGAQFGPATFVVARIVK